MKGLFPFLRELFFGPKKRRCLEYEYCDKPPLNDCVSICCAEHCRRACKCGAGEPGRLSSVREEIALWKWPSSLE